jgi:protein TonB
MRPFAMVLLLVVGCGGADGSVAALVPTGRPIAIPVPPTPGEPPPAAPVPPTASGAAEPPARPVGLVRGSKWRCPFPPEADIAKIDQAVVTVRVTVQPDGTASSATVTSDPGYGFGRVARLCALGMHYSPAVDRTGTPITASAPVTVRFQR